MEINQRELQQAIKDGFVSARKHPKLDLWIYNYTPAAQYSKVWNKTIMQCRGLILDTENNIVARPFEKFFNVEEHDSPDLQDLPNEPFDIYEKLDGSLGIVYFIDNKPYIATKGSFVSEQSARANELLNKKYKSIKSALNPEKTYLFEIIYPKNRIVVDYAGKEELILLAIIDTATGQEEPLADIGFPLVKKYNLQQEIPALKSLNTENCEGFVLKYKSGIRAKIKFHEYIRLHRLVAEVSSITIWTMLSEGKSINELLEKVPDEFYDWVRKTVSDLNNQFSEKKSEIEKVFSEIAESEPIDKKEFAEKARKTDIPKFLFVRAFTPPDVLDKIIWNSIKPIFQKPIKK